MFYKIRAVKHRCYAEIEEQRRFEEESLLLQLSEDNNITVVFDAGLAPGIPNFLLGNIDAKENVKSFKYFVGCYSLHLQSFSASKTGTLMDLPK